MSNSRWQCLVNIDSSFAWLETWLTKTSLYQQQLLFGRSVTRLPRLLLMFSFAFSESLRLYPVAPYFFWRQTKASIDWKGRTIPKSTVVIPMIRVLNQDPSFYGSDAEVFRPDRHLSSEILLRALQNDVSTRFPSPSSAHGSYPTWDCMLKMI